MEKKDTNPYLKSLFPIVDCIADLFGPNCEVVLHDISDPEHSIVKIKNGQVTGRKVGAPLTDVALEMIKEAEKDLKVLGNYNPRTKNGRLLKSNAVNIKDPKGKLIGIMCINVDISKAQQLQQSIQFINQIIEDFAYVKEETVKAKEEHFESDLWTILQEMIDNVIKERGISVDLLNKENRLEIIKKLNEKGIFFFKGANHFVARALGISSPTIYRYLEELRLWKE
jgi:predicted transcriptional regulator YheO